MHTETVRNLIDHIETSKKNTLFTAFSTTRLLSEFFIYYVYLLYVAAKTTDGLYINGPELAVTVWPHDDCLHALMSIAETDSDKVFFGLHRERLSTLGPAEKRIMETFWRRYGLLQDCETLSDFSNQPTRRRLR